MAEQDSNEVHVRVCQQQIVKLDLQIQAFVQVNGLN